MKTGFWKKDWFLGLAVTLVLFAAGGTNLIQGIERTAYDWGVQASSRTSSDKVVVIAIDDASIRNIGRWPWSREVHAKMTETLANAKAKVIGNLVFFSEPQVDAGFGYISRLLEIYAKLVPTPPEGAPAPSVSPEMVQIGAMLREAETSLNTDRKLADAYGKAANVLLPMLFELGRPQGKADKPLPEFITRNQLTSIDRKSSDDAPLPASAVISLPIEEIAMNAAGIGHLNANADVDGGIRTEPMVLQFFDQFYPSMSVMLAAKSLNLGVGDIKVQLGDGVKIGNLKIGTDPALQMYTFFYKDRDGRPAFRVDSFFDVYSGKIPVDSFRDKIVLIGPTAAGVGTTSVTSISPAMPPVLTLAYSVSSMLQEYFYVRPTWALWVELLVFGLVAAYLIVLLPRLTAGTGAAVTAGVAALLLIVHFVLMTGQGMWLQFMWSLSLLVIGHVLLITKRFVVTERGKEASDASSAANARMLGLAFQGQGQLDMAFDYFRKCPLSTTR